MGTEFRWLRIHANDIGSSHPSAVRFGDTSYYHVFQVRKTIGPRGEQWWDSWEDVPIEDYEDPNA